MRSFGFLITTTIVCLVLKTFNRCRFPHVNRKTTVAVAKATAAPAAEEPADVARTTLLTIAEVQEMKLKV